MLKIIVATVLTVCGIGGLVVARLAEKEGKDPVPHLVVASLCLLMSQLALVRSDADDIDEKLDLAAKQRELMCLHLEALKRSVSALRLDLAKRGEARESEELPSAELIDHVKATVDLFEADATAATGPAVLVAASKTGRGRP